MPELMSEHHRPARMKEPAQVQASIDRYRNAFWARRQAERPPIAVVPARTWLPIGYIKEALPGAYVTPDQVTRAAVRTDYEDVVAERGVYSDDWLPYVAPWRAVPWLEAICGCPVRQASGSLAPEHWIDDAEALAEVALPASMEWHAAMHALTLDLVQTAPADAFVSPTILRGTSDALAAMRGLSNFYLDLHDNPAAIARAAANANRLFLALLDRHFAAVPEHLGGYGHIYGYWAPAPSNVLQEDVLGMVAPRVYRDIFMPLNAQAVQHLGPYTMFHLHTTGLRHYRHVMDVPGIAGLEITVETNGPSLRALAPMLREISARTRLVLFVDAFFEDLPDVLRQLPADGVYVMISDRFIATEQEFREFVGRQWSSRIT